MRIVKYLIDHVKEVLAVRELKKSYIIAFRNKKGLYLGYLGKGVVTEGRRKHAVLTEDFTEARQFRTEKSAKQTITKMLSTYQNLPRDFEIQTRLRKLSATG